MKGDYRPKITKAILQWPLQENINEILVTRILLQIRIYN